MLDANGDNLGANLPGCLSAKGASGDACPTAYWNVIQCLVGAGCFTDPSATESCATLDDGGVEMQCQQTALGGACSAQYNAYKSGCATDLGTDGGVGVSGACATEQDVLSVLCGNGSGDGG